MKNLASLFALVILLLASSCSIEEIDKAIERFNDNMVGNAKNELDQVGKIHNEALGYIDLQMQSRYKGKALDPALLIALIMEFQEGKTNALEEKLVQQIVRHYFELLASGQPITASTIDICQFVPVICNPGPPPFNPELPTFAYPVMTDKHATNYANAVRQVDAIKAFENNLLNDPSLGENQRQAYLSYLSTYRHSTQYWYNAANVDGRLITEMDQPNRVCNTCAIIEADAAGAYLGSWFGPWGAGIGGAAASAAAAYEIYK